jgi:hypothetical protein
LRKAKHLEEVWAYYLWRAKTKERKKEEEEKLEMKHVFYRVSGPNREEKQ